MSKANGPKRVWVTPVVRQIEANEALDLMFAHAASRLGDNSRSPSRPLRSAIR